jgi:hypothetical protein
MGIAFADSEYDDEQKSQLTLGTASLLSIFFSLVMICGLFFGLGYSLGRRSYAQMANLKPQVGPAPVKTAAVTGPPPAPPLAISHPSVTVQPPAAPASLPQKPASIAGPPAVAHVETAPARPAAPAPALSQAPPAPAAQVPIATLLASKQYLPKPSAIHPAVVQPRTNIPYTHGVAMPTTYQATPVPWHWTPPFDVKPTGSHTRVARAYRPSHPEPIPSSGVTTETAGYVEAKAVPEQAVATPRSATVQIAALSREDDAQVLADALRKRGFIASIRNGGDDSLYHVQVGPLERRIALATQQRLIAKGYNAVVK